jgi:hypothetical protein
MGIKEIMQIFSVLSLLVMIFATLAKTTLNKIFGFNIALTLKFKITSFFVVITLAYVSASLIVAFSDKLDGGFYFVFIVFYFINLISATGYFLLDALSRKFERFFQNKIAIS